MSDYRLPTNCTLEADGYGKGYDVLTMTILHKNGISMRYMATLDWKRRCSYSGMTTHGKPTSPKKYTGRHWAQRLLDDTCRWLEDLSK